MEQVVLIPYQMNRGISQTLLKQISQQLRNQQFQLQLSRTQITRQELVKRHYQDYYKNKYTNVATLATIQVNKVRVQILGGYN